MARFGKLSIDGTKVRANASKHKAMSYGRMQEEERRLAGEIDALVRAARDADAAEDERFGPDARGDELPSELRRREDRLATIRAAKERLEAAQRAADDAGGRQPGQARNPKGGQPYKRGYGEPDEKAQSNFTDPESGIMKTSNDGFQQCYNAQVAVDGEHQLVVATEVTANASDQGGLPPHASPYFCRHQITPKISRYTRCSMSMLPNVSINRRTRSSGQLGRWWYSISPCRNNECVRRFTVFAFNQRS